MNTISAKSLRDNLKEIVLKASAGEEFTVIYRSKPAFVISPIKPSRNKRKSKENKYLEALELGRGLGTSKPILKASQEKQLLRKRLIAKHVK